MKPELIIVLVMVTIFVVSFRIFAKRIKQDGSPRAMKRRFRWNFYYSLFAFGLLFITQVQSHGIRPGFLIFWAIFMISSTYLAFKSSVSEQDALKNYWHDSDHCGRCEYNLTGNTSGVCPECGWAIPLERGIVESPRWGLWWREWKINYLDNWRKTLAGMVITSLIFAGLTIFILLKTSPFAIILALLCLHCVINSIRVAQYGRHQPKTN